MAVSFSEGLLLGEASRNGEDFTGVASKLLLGEASRNGEDFIGVALKLLLVEVCRNQCMCWVAYVVRLSNHCK